MFNKKYLKVLLLATTMALFVTGCSGDTDEGNNEEVEQSEDLEQDTDKAKEDESEKDKEDADKEEVELIVYAGAGLKRAMEEIKPAFEEQENVNIQYVYAGSGQLLSQMETSGKGDVFIVGSEATYDMAKDKGQANESTLIAHHTPGLAVEKGNPKGIKSLKDLTQDGLRVALGDKEANAVGKTAVKIIEKNNLEAIEDNVVATMATVNELVVAIASGEADVAIVTEDSIRFNEDVELVEIPEEENIDQIIPAGTLTSSEHPDLAQKLVDFIASDEGKAIFEKNGYKTLK